MKDELEGYVDCGVLSRGFAVLACRSAPSASSWGFLSRFWLFHFHALALDGVYSEDEQGELTFHPLPCLTNGDVADILQIAETRILRLLRRQGVIDDAAVNADETLAETEPALAELAVASTLGRGPAGPTLRQKDPIRLPPGQEFQHPKGLCAAARGFSLHPATTARTDDAVGREALCKYILRPPIAQHNIRLVANDLVRLQLKRALQ